MIRAALHRDVQDICKETCHNLGWDISKTAMELVTELVYKKLSIYGLDLKAFAKHANRTTIKTDDVKLLARRCPSLVAHLEKLAPATPISKKRKHKSIAPQEIPEKDSACETPKQKEPRLATPSWKADMAHISIIQPETPSSTSSSTVPRNTFKANFE